MKGNERIMKRVAELQEQGAERSAVTLESLIAEAFDIQAKALAKEKFSAAVSALTVKAGRCSRSLQTCQRARQPRH
jgi:hypothetical protein